MGWGLLFAPLQAADDVYKEQYLRSPHNQRSDRDEEFRS